MRANKQSMFLWYGSFCCTRRFYLFSVLMKSQCGHSNESYRAEHVLMLRRFILLYEVVLSFESVDEIAVWAFKWKLLSRARSYVTVHLALQGSSIFWACWWNGNASIQMKALEQYFRASVPHFALNGMVLTVESVNGSQKCEHWYASYWVILQVAVLMHIMLQNLVLTFACADAEKS